jgi:hypothetical protein
VSSADPVRPGPRSGQLGLASNPFSLPGCPACRHLAEASDEYLGWLLLGGHSDLEILNRLSASRGLCAAHTRILLAQPGAEARLTAVYRHVIEAALGDVAAQPATCPACEHASTAADRFFGYLLGEATRGDRRTYKRHGGLCVPHLRLAAVARRGADVRWLVRFMIVRLTAASPPGVEVLAGQSHEAGDPLVASGGPGEGAAGCVVCAAGTEAARSQRASDAKECLCERHLRDEVSTAGSRVTDLLAKQAALHAARLAPVVDGRARNLGNYLPVRARRALADPDCPVCRRAEAACTAEIDRVAHTLLEPESGSESESPARLALCLRHAREVHAVDEHAGRLADARLTALGQGLLGELAAAADSCAGEHRAGSLGPQRTAVRRSAAFLDGSAFRPGVVVLPCYGRDGEAQLRHTSRRRGSP